MAATTTGTGTKVEELKGHQEIDDESGSLLCYRHFRVQREGHDEHIVRIEVSESGTPQHESCDCRAYQYRRDCAHIMAVYEAGVLSCDWAD